MEMPERGESRPPIQACAGARSGDHTQRGEDKQESGQDDGESIVEKMEQAAQRAKEESGHVTDAHQQISTRRSPLTNGPGGPMTVGDVARCARRPGHHRGGAGRLSGACAQR
jgi:hypothetical protein